VVEQTSGKRAGVDFGVAMNPEFMRPGTAVSDFVNPEQLVLGTADNRTLSILERLYDGVRDVPRIHTSVRTAEMIKYVYSSLRATLISFSNEVGDLCAAHPDVDALEVLGGVHLDGRLAGHGAMAAAVDYLLSGWSFGECAPRNDVRALIAHARDRGSSMPLLQAVLETDADRPSRAIAPLQRHFRSLKDVRIAVLGAALAPSNSDAAESPAVSIIEQLVAHDAIVFAYDPCSALELPPHLQTRVSSPSSLPDCIENVEAILILTDWPEFSLLPELLRHQLASPLVIDGRRQLRREAASMSGAVPDPLALA
jgi:UDPglucose 6-dehydrogenase